MATQLYLVLTDGTTTITIADGAGGLTNYRLAYGSWSPAVAGLRSNQLAGRGPYDDVEENLTLNIYGTSAANAYANLQTLARLLYQAERWMRGESVTAVLMKYSPAGGTVSSVVNPLQATVLGHLPGGQSGLLQLTTDFNDLTSEYVIRNIQVRFLRLGLLLHTSASAASSATNNADIATVNMGGFLNLASPTKIEISNIISNPSLSPALLILSGSGLSDEIGVADAEDGASGAPWTSVNDAGASARNTNVLRYTPTGTTESVSGGVTPGVSGGLINSFVAVFMNARNNSATTSFRIRARLQESPSTPGITVYGPTIVIPPYSGAAAPRWYFAGLIAAPFISPKVALAATASAASGTIDFDSIVVVNMSSPYNYVVQFQDPLADSLNVPYILDHRLLTQPSPNMLRSIASGPPVAFNGDAIVMTRGQYLYGLLLLSGSNSSTLNKWRQESGGTIRQNTWTLTRTTGYLTPE